MSAVPPAFERYGEDDLAQAEAFGPGKDGRFEARLAREPGGRTRLLEEFTRVPYHLTGTLDIDPAPGLTTLCLQEPTGGVAQGDRHSIDVTAEERARAHLTTQSATKVHSMTGNYAHLAATLQAGSDAYLEYLPGPTILNEDARCLQTISVDLAESAVVVLSDVLVPDGLSAHEPFEFDHYASSVEARCDGRLVCADAVDLQPTAGRPADPATMDEYEVLGTLYAFAPATDTASLADEVYDRTSESAGVAAGVSALPHEAGVSVRVLGHRTASVVSTIEAAWAGVRAVTLGTDIPDDRWY